MAPPKFTVDSGLKKPARKPPPKKPAGAFPTTKKPAVKPLHGPFATAVADEAAAAEAEVRRQEIKAQLAQIKKVTTQRSKATTAKIAGNRVAAQHGLAPVGQPFAGTGNDTGAAARDPYVPDLTAKTQVAKGNRERLQHGGLLTPEQQAREKVNAKTVGSSTAFTFHDKYGHLREQVPALRDLPETLPIPKGFKAQPLETTEEKDKSWLPDSLSGPLSPRLGELAGKYLPQGIDAATGAVRAVGGPVFDHLPNVVQDVAAKPFTDPVGAGVDYARRLADPFHVEDAARVVAKKAGHPLPENPLATGNRTERAGEAGTELAGKLSDVGLDYDPNVPVPNADFLGVSAANAAGTTTVDDIPVAAGLTPEATTKWYNKALALGWNKADLDGIVGVELIKRGIAPPPPWYERLPVQFAAGVARTAAAPVAIQALATDALTGHAGRAAQQLGEGLIAPLPFIGKHPWGQMFMNDPYTVGSAVLPAARAAGAAGLLRRGASPERLVNLRSTGAEVSRGPHSKNLVDQIGEDIHDLAASKSKIISRRVDKKVTDVAHQRAVNSELPQLTDRDHAYALAHSKVGKKRAVVLMAYADSGHLPEAKVRQFEGEAVDAPGGAGAGAHKFWQRVVAETKHLDENDHAFLKALDESARLTSEKMGIEKGFGEDAQEFRRHETAIVAQAHAGDELGAEIMQMRHELYGNGKGDAPDMSGVKQRLAALEAERRNSTRRRNASQKVVDKPLPEEPAILAKQREDVAAYEVERKKWSDERKAILAEEPAPTKLRKNASAKTREAAEVKDKAATKEWKAKLTAHNKTKPKRPPGKQVERAAHVTEKNKVKGTAKPARIRRAVHSSNEGRQLKKIQRLKDRLEYHTHRTQAARASLEEDYHDALTQFAKEHKDRGGQTPTRVQRVQAPPVNKRRHQATARVRFGNGQKRRAKPSKSVLATTGAHLYDSSSPLVESAAAQRLVTGTAAGRNLLSRGTPAKGHDVVPQGQVFVSDKSATTLGRVVNDYQDNPVDAEDFFKREDGMRHALVRAWTNEPMLREGETVAPGEKGVFLPKAQVDRAIEYMQPISRDKWDRFNSFYSRQLISLYPSTMLGNTVGTQPMAWMAGAGPLSARRALRSMRDKTLVPHTAHRAGAVGSMRTMAAGRNPIKRYQAWMRKGTAWGEDFAKHMVYWKAVTRDMKKAHKALNESETDGLQTTFDDYARMVARGEENIELQDRGLAAANKAMGEGLTPDGMLGRFVGKHVLFHRWVGHIAKLMLVTMPFERPGTLLLLNTMAAYGDQYRKDHGVFPSWMQSFAGLADRVIGGHNFTLAVNLGQLAPQNSIGSPLVALTQRGPWLDRLAGLLAPRDKIVIDMAWQQAQNSMGSGSHIDLGRMLINEGIYTLPGAAKFAPRSGHRPDSIPYFAPRTWDYTDGTRDTAYHDNSVAWEDRTGVRPLGSDAPVASWENFYGILSRILGAPLSYTPREGDLNDQINAKTEAKAKKDAGISTGYAKP